ncbi:MULTISPECIES: efflux RND transporter permease subunit [unclassified Rhizobium]|uniref:efflux RND transporter permease subunit n=1 Tax=unclassified Rhizobium TaxID=2613769 RepID=UPI00160C94FB|nr:MULTISPECIES: efflux RND transporter permease subunit [unclassified Rhizobium]MBB3289697.1 hydrophobe/amphiphile efflux-1 (HAE1) family protein [Rhizobium sp. BK252]MBB3404640.1 hydrophobe/amphiphile efflux-1 (HAE1) family protein [Rhizobium sp. BK289]MBB3416988.1 hydrophobe/amphiphile efflux-1 (HAE1) family protein [Rhizobium sp. BK284]MBB3484865.1 hydrophobe/amphiphile efflux-1 (HAE1) family protein [Rhizobium sp. BK347]MDK4718204.1 efflux RND transporter permease subunit [Rhizobium sp. C
MSISSWFIKKPIATSLLMVGLFTLGVVAYPLLPIAPLPQVDFPTIQVSTQLPGADPKTIASSVTQPLERQFGQIPGVAQMTSSSTLGSSAITLQFDLSRNIDSAAQDVQTAINAASGQLPSGLPSPPTYRKVNPADPPIMILALTSDTLPLTKVDDFAENVLAQHISQLNGVSQVLVFGQQKPAVRIQVDPGKIASLGISMEDVRSAVSTITTDAPKGSIQGADRTYTIYDNDQLLDAAPWNDAIIAYKNGGPIRVRDIGEAVDGAENNQLAAWANGKPAIILPIFKLPGANVIDTVDHIKEILPQLQAIAPAALNVSILSDRTVTIRASVLDVEKTLLITIVLVVVVIFVFLRNFWGTVIPSVTVPLALMATLALMYVAGFSLDNLSLMGLSIAVGFVVDDAIVMVENIHRHMEMGKSPFQAALDGSAEIGFTIISISLSLVAVFIPLLLMGGIVGELFREFAITVTMTIAVSAVVSLTITPMMSSRFLKADKADGHGRLYLLFEDAFDRMLSGYEYTLDKALRHHRVTFAFFLLSLAATGYVFVEIPKGFFPIQDTGLITGVLEASQDISFAKMSALQVEAGKIVQSDPAVASTSMQVGGGSGSTVNMSRMFITLKPLDQRDASASQVIDRLRPRLQELEGAQLFLQSAQDINIGGRSSATQFQYTLQDGDPAELNEWAGKLLAKFRSLPEITDVATDQQNAGTTVTLAIDRDKASRYGIAPQLIDNILYDAFGQRQVTQYFTDLNSYHVILEIAPALGGSPSSIDDLYVKSPLTGEQVPLNALVKQTTEPTAVLAVNHQSQFPSVTLSFNLSSGIALSQAVSAIQAAEKQMGTPATLIGSFQGNAQAFQSSLASEPLLVLAAIAVIYLILGVLYESYFHPLTILSTLPSAGLGALLMLWIFGFGFTVIALIGVILLIGIVKKNGIMIVDFAVEDQRNNDSSPEEAIRKACLLRFRPIIMTTSAALLAGIPLMLGHGTGSELRQPLGYSIVGGLVISQIMTLYTTPVVYLYLERLSRMVSAKDRAAEAAQSH